MAKSDCGTQVKNKLLILHLSDIHFEEPKCLNPDTDPDHAVRKILLNDIRDMVKTLGMVDVVLISGDIAFKCHADEYKSASAWLSEVADITGCSQNRIFTVPGNHDLDRNIAKARKVMGVRSLVSGDLHKRNKEFRATLVDSESNLFLFEPMEEYNKFAAAYNCGIYPDKPFWSQEIEISPTWTLKIHGLTTTFFSGPDDDEKGDLFLSDIQSTFAPDDGIIRLSIMHHPPDWLFDNETVDDALWEGCELHMIGHKHKQRYQATDQSIRIAASAVNPERSESNWEPGYNFIQLNISEDDKKHFLEAETHIRIWQNSPDRFVPKYTRGDSTVFEKRLVLEKEPKQLKTAEINKDDGGNTKLEAHARVKTGEDLPEVDINTFEGSVMSKRDLVFDFWRKLSTSQRREIMERLNLIEKSDYDLPETMRYHLAFKRAREKDLVKAIENEINQILNN